MNRSTGRSKDERLVLGIETSCDETAAAVVARSDEGRGRILSNIVRSQLDEHRPFGGVVPEIAARAHAECLDDIVTRALAEGGVSLADLDAVAATAGPGLNSGLIVGVVTGKALALAVGKPFIAINHLEAHALTVGLTEGLPPPYLVLLVSGGHTQLLLVTGVGRYERIGTTIDDALGEAFDKTAKLLGLGFPGGPAVEQAAAAGDEKRFAFPRPMLGREEAHFSFAGLKTAVRHQAQALVPLTARDISDLCASFQAAACDSVVDRVKRAIEICRLGRSADAQADAGGQTPSPTNVGSPPLCSDRPSLQLVVAGGVAANMRLKTALQKLADETWGTLHIPPPALCTDNAAMIAWAGAERLALGLTDRLDAPVRPRWPLDADAPPAIGAGVKA